MKFNLKNRPEIRHYSGAISTTDKIAWFDGLNELMKEWDKWFEAFEKELREMKSKVEKAHEENNPRVNYFYELIKEILGEKE